MFDLRNFFSASFFCIGLASAATVPTTPHPDWSLIPLRVGGAASLQPMVSGMEFMTDGRLVLAHWGGSRANITGRQYLGRVYIVSGVTGNNPSPTFTTFAQGLQDPMGLCLINNQIYVAGGDTILQLLDANNDGVSDGQRTLLALNPGSVHGRSEWTYGLTYANGTFYTNPSSSVNPGTGDQQSNPNRGVHLAVNGSTGAYQIAAYGFRHPDGLAVGPAASLWTVEVQGEWNPTNKLINIRTGRHYGFKHTPRETWDNLPESPAAVFLPQPDVSYSPAGPLYIPSGLYAGQFFLGDVRWGGIQRAFVEQVNGDYQGCYFVFSGGLEAGVHRMAWGPDGMLYAGMIGATGGDWSFGTQYFGLQKLGYDNPVTPTFEMLAVRSRAGGMEIEFTQPVAAAAELASSYQVQTYYFLPTSAYGGGALGGATLTVGTPQLSADRRSVFLPITGLLARTAAQPQRIVYIRLINVRSQIGNAVPWTPETWYSLNAISTSAPFTPTPIIDPAAHRAELQTKLRCKLEGNQLVVEAPFAGRHEIWVRDMQGRIRANSIGYGRHTHRFTHLALHGLAAIEAQGDGIKLRRTFIFPL